MTVEALLEAAKQLNASERLRLVGQVWDTVADEDAEDELEVTLTPDQTAELDRRLDRLDHEGSAGMPWEDFKQQLLKRASP